MNSNDSLLPGLELQVNQGNDLPLHQMVEHNVPNVGPTAQPPRRPRFTPYTTKDFGLFPEAEWAIDGLLPAQGIACVYGPPGCGKSAVIGSMIFSLDTGLPWSGREVEPCVVWSIVLEGPSGQSNRILALEKYFGQRLSESTKFVFDDLRLTQPEDVAELAERIKQSGGKLGAL